MPGATTFDEEVAAHYEGWYETEEGRRADALEKASLRQLLRHVPDAHSVLEVGCGTGHFTRWLDGLGMIAIGLDLSGSMLSEAEALDAVPLVQADAHRLPFADDSLDLTAFVTTLEFLESPQRALAEAVRVTSCGVLLGVLNRWSILGLRRRVGALFRHSIYETAKFYSVPELRQRLHRAALDAIGGVMDHDIRTVWHTTLFPPWMPWRIAEIPWGGFIAMVLLLPDGDQSAG